MAQQQKINDPLAEKKVTMHLNCHFFTDTKKMNRKKCENKFIAFRLTCKYACDSSDRML